MAFKKLHTTVAMELVKNLELNSHIGSNWTRIVGILVFSIPTGFNRFMIPIHPSLLTDISCLEKNPTDLSSGRYHTSSICHCRPQAIGGYLCCHMMSWLNKIRNRYRVITSC